MNKLRKKQAETRKIIHKISIKSKLSNKDKDDLINLWYWMYELERQIAQK